jgi:hypothetical protein
VSKLVPPLREGADELEALLLASARNDAPSDPLARAQAIAAAKLAAHAAHAAIGAGAAGGGAVGWRALVTFGSATSKGIFLAGVGIAVALGGADVMGWPAPTRHATSIQAPASPVVVDPAPLGRGPAPASTVGPQQVSPPEKGAMAVSPAGLPAVPAPMNARDPAAAGGAPAMGTESTESPRTHDESTAAAPRPSVGAALVTEAAGATGSAVTPTLAPASAMSLGKERALLESARESLAASQAVRALAMLDRYDAEFTSGQLAEDAAVLRIQALMATGNRAEAGRLAQIFGRRFPSSSYAPRVRALVEKSP